MSDIKSAPMNADHLITQIRGFTYAIPSASLEGLSGESDTFRVNPQRRIDFWAQFGLEPPSASNRPLNQPRERDTLKDIKTALGPNRPLAALVFDTETDASPGQVVRVGYAEVRGCSIADAKDAWLACGKDASALQDHYDRELRHGILHRTLFYDKAVVTPAEIATLKAFRDAFNAAHGLRSYVNARLPSDAAALRLVDTEKFIAFLTREIVNGHPLIGHNLAFDLAGIATNALQAKDEFYGGFRLMLCPCKRDMLAKGIEVADENTCSKHPSIRMKKVGANKFFYRATSIKGKKKLRATFIDTLTLAKTLFPGESGSLKTLRRTLGIDARFEKPDVDHGNILDKRYLDYLVNDVQLTYEVFCKLCDEYSKHQLGAKISNIYSGASIAKAYHREFGMTTHGENLRAYTKDSEDVQAAKMIEAYYAGLAFAAFYAGRVNIYRRKETVEVMATDFTSCYSAVNALLRNQTLMFATRLVRRHCRDEIAQTLRGLTREQLLARETWPNLRGYARIRPNGDWLPHRAKFGHDAANIAFGPFFSDKPHWYALPDIAASVIRTGRVPELLDGFLLETDEPIAGNKFAIMGDARFVVNPEQDDIFATVIDLRQTVKADQKAAEKDGKKGIGKSTDLALKTIGNTGSYGVFVEVNPIYDGPQKFDALIFHGVDEPARVSIACPEGPGKFCNPELGSLVTSGAHLLLSLGELTAKARGIALAYCDTDSLYFERPDGWTRERFQNEVENTCQELQGLSPYASGTQLLKIEDKNFDARRAGEYRPLFFYGASSKRYCVFNKTEREGLVYGVRLRFVSAHGLGPYISFADYVSPYRMRAKDEQRGHDGGYPSVCSVKRWHYDLWRAEIERVLGISNRDPLAPLRDLPAALQFTASNWRDLVIARRNYWPDCRPLAFFVTMSAPDGVDWKMAVAPSDQKRRASWTLANRTVLRHGGVLESISADEPYHSLADALGEYFDNPEPKMSDPYGVGRMHERTVVSIGQQVIGKETDRLFEDGGNAGYIGQGEMVAGVLVDVWENGDDDVRCGYGAEQVDVSRVITMCQKIMYLKRRHLAKCIAKNDHALLALRKGLVDLDRQIQRKRLANVLRMLRDSMEDVKIYAEIPLSLWTKKVSDAAVQKAQQKAMQYRLRMVDTRFCPHDVLSSIMRGDDEFLTGDLVVQNGVLYERVYEVADYVVFADDEDGCLHAYDTNRTVEEAKAVDEEQRAKRRAENARQRFAKAVQGITAKYGIKWLADLLSVSCDDIQRWVNGAMPRNKEYATSIIGLWDGEKRDGSLRDDFVVIIRMRHERQELTEDEQKEMDAKRVEKRRRKAERAKRAWLERQGKGDKGQKKVEEKEGVLS